MQANSTIGDSSVTVSERTNQEIEKGTVMDNIEKLYGEWLSLQPLKEEDSIRLNQKFMLEFNYNSNHMEGNTLTYKGFVWTNKAVY